MASPVRWVAAFPSSVSRRGDRVARSSVGERRVLRPHLYVRLNRVEFRKVELARVAQASEDFEGFSDPVQQRRIGNVAQ